MTSALYPILAAVLYVCAAGLLWRGLSAGKPLLGGARTGVLVLAAGALALPAPPPAPARCQPGAGGAYRDFAAVLQPAQHRRGAEPGIEPAGTRPASPAGGRLSAQSAAARNHGTSAVPHDCRRLHTADAHSREWRVLLR